MHRYCGYIRKCDDPAENIAEPMCGQNGWVEDVKDVTGMEAQCSVLGGVRLIKRADIAKQRIY